MKNKYGAKSEENLFTFLVEYHKQMRHTSELLTELWEKDLYFCNEPDYFPFSCKIKMEKDTRLCEDYYIITTLTENGWKDERQVIFSKDKGLACIHMHGDTYGIIKASDIEFID